MAVVEDDVSFLQGLDRLLTACGHEVEAFHSAEAFLALIDRTRASCLLIDVHLTGISGIELHRRLVASGRTFPVIFMSATDREVIRREASQTGFVAFLQKPFPPQLLLDAIEKASTNDQ
jgi:FixJ family two-component response regulator